MERPIYIITDGDLSFISMVEDPAIEENFLCFSKEQKPIPMKFDDGKRIITGPAMIPDLDIYRYNNSIGEYYVRFTKEVIEKIALKFFKQHRNSDVNLNHSETKEGITILESYFIDHQRGVVPTEFSDLPDGTWITSYKCENDEMWEKAKRGEVKGFSVEGVFDFDPTPINEEEVIEDEMEALLKALV